MQFFTVGMVEFFVSEEDYDFVLQYKWYDTFGTYPFTYIGDKRKTLHSMISERMGLIVREGEILDHKDINSLNARRDNFRVVVFWQSSLNKDRKSETPGVYKIESTNKWKAEIQFRCAYYTLGQYENKEIALKVRDLAALLLRGREWAYLNCPELEEKYLELLEQNNIKTIKDLKEFLGIKIQVRGLGRFT